MHPLVADGGELTVLRTIASYTWGKWSVEWPESVPEDHRNVPPAGKELGFLSELPVEPSGRMARRFVRGDVSISAAEYSPDGQALPLSGFSDVEQVLDSASSRTEGGAFLERDITRAGLGSLEPRVDFDVGDVVPVMIWGKVLRLPVTLIEAVTAAGAVVDWNVHVGSQVVDSAAREQSVLALRRDIAAERRERLKELGAVESRFSGAIVAEREARVEALKAESAARAADLDAEREARVEAIGGLNAQFETLAGDVSDLAAASSELAVGLGNAVTTADFEQYDAALQEDLWTRQQAFNELSSDFQVEQSRINEQQIQLNAQQVEIDKAQSDAIDALTSIGEETRKILDQLAADSESSFAEIRGIQEQLARPQFGAMMLQFNRNYDFDYFQITKQSNGTYQILFKRGWAGSATIEVYDAKDQLNGTVWDLTPIFQRSYTKASDAAPYYQGGITAEGRYVRVSWAELAKMVKDSLTTTGAVTPAQGVWTTLSQHSFTSPDTADFAMRFDVTWNGAAYNPTYGMRVLVNGAQVLGRTTTKLGPLLPLGNGYIPWWVGSSKVSLSAGDRVEFQIYSSSGNSWERAIAKSKVTCSWVGTV